MKKITQKELIKLIEAKQENAENTYKIVHDSLHSANKKEEDSRHDRLITNKAYIDCYQDLICYIQSVVIVRRKNNEK